MVKKVNQRKAAVHSASAKGRASSAPRPSSRSDSHPNSHPNSHPRGQQRGQQRPQLHSRPQRSQSHPQRPQRSQKNALPSSYLEGRRACFEALEQGVSIARALVQKDLVADDFSQLKRRLCAAKVPLKEVDASYLDALSSHGAHQGIVLELKPFVYTELVDLTSRVSQHAHEHPGEPMLVLMLDHVVDEGNLGACIRTAEIVGAQAVIIPNARAASVGTGTYKTSAGAVLHIPIVRTANLARALAALKDEGFWVIGATEHADASAFATPFEGNVCVVMGSEYSGISEGIRKSCDFLCKLPQRGAIESLNVAQAATVMCYEWLRRNEGNFVE